MHIIGSGQLQAPASLHSRLLNKRLSRFKNLSGRNWNRK